MCNLKLYHAKRKPYIINTQKCRRLLWARAQLRWTDAKWKSVLWSDESTFQNVFGNDIVSSGPKRKWTIRIVISAKFKSQHLWWYGGVLTPMAWVTCTSVKESNNAERYIHVLEQHMLPSKQRLFQGHPCLFEQHNANPHSARVTTAWLCSKRVRVIDWPGWWLPLPSLLWCYR